MGKHKFGLKLVKVEDIQPNPNNPRGVSVRDNDDQFQYLKRSIKKLGLIVPIVVQKKANRKGKYVLLDGERRYYAVKELGIREVPAHVLDVGIDADEGKNLMFHVHTTRLQWDPYQQCKALEPLYRELKRKFKGNENSVAKQLILATGTNQRTVNSRLNFLRWPKQLKQLVYEEKPELYYTIVEIEAQIITPALKNFPYFFEQVPVDEVREFLLRKYLKGVVHAAIETRRVTHMLKTPSIDKAKHSYALSLFKKLVRKTDYTFENAHDDFISRFPGADEEISATFRKVNLALARAINLLGEFDYAVIEHLTASDKQKFSLKLSELREVINGLLPESSGD